MPKFINIKGQKFGDWTVLEYLGNGKWLCECSCENHTRRGVLGKTLRNGKSKSCGHDTNQFKDLTGKEFGMWKVIEFLGDSKYKCECSCENHTIKVINRASLISGNSTNCGCVRKAKLIERNKASRIKLEGTRVWEWDVLEYVGDKHYICRCTCDKHRVKRVAAMDLLHGISKSCGHNNGKNLIKDITGQKFGELTVIRYLGNKLWECECSCENHTIVKVRKGNLLNGSTKSCGCKQYNRLTKNEIIKAIAEFKEAYDELPFIQDLSTILDRHEKHIRRYIKQYELEDYINKKFGSRAEREIYYIFKDKAILNNRSIIPPYELDIYIPDKKVAIEFNGTYWHSDIYKDKRYHQNKTLECAKKGIRLIHIFEYEWQDDEKKEKILNILNNILENNKIILGARKVEVKQITNNQAYEFEDKYHLQNSASSTVNIGCYYNNEIIGVMTFGKPRFNKEYEYELIRLCWHPKYIVSGGTNKMFKHFIKTYNPSSIITYTDISKFTGNVYLKMGFNVIKQKPITEPNYVWVNTSTNSVLTRYQTQKKILVEQGLGTSDQTEDEIMVNNGFFKIYDAGNIRLEWKEN